MKPTLAIYRNKRGRYLVAPYSETRPGLWALYAGPREAAKKLAASLNDEAARRAPRSRRGF